MKVIVDLETGCLLLERQAPCSNLVVAECPYRRSVEGVVCCSIACPFVDINGGVIVLLCGRIERQFPFEQRDCGLVNALEKPNEGAQDGNEK